MRVYPTEQPQGVPLDESFDFDRAKQIEAYEDSSFLVTEEGAVYSWGKNENGFLGRETKLAVNQMTGQ